MKKEQAKIVSDLMVDCSTRIHASLKIVREGATDDEYERYVKTTSKLVGVMITDIMNPLYVEHPDLMPPEAAGMDPRTTN